MKIRVENWFGCSAREAELPDCGLTVVRGRNGAGKSSFFVEAVSEALFGKTARGTKSDPPYLCEVSIGSLAVRREHDKRAARVTWSYGGDSQGAAEGATKATKRIIETLKLDHDAWHRTHVFSAEKVAQFSTASDADRKALLESLLGLADFDVALKRVREDKRQAAARLSSAKADMDRARAVHEAAQEGLEEAEEAAEEVPDVDLPALAAKVASAEKALKKSEARAERAEAELAEHVSEVAAHKTKVALARAEVTRAAQTVRDTACPTCGRDYDKKVDKEALKTAHKAAARAFADAEKGLNAAIAARNTCEAAADVARTAAKRAREELRDAQRLLEAGKGATARAEDATRRVASAQLKVDEAFMDVVEAGGELEAAAHEVRVIGGAEDILGTRGARARVLGAALVSLESGANRALSVMGSHGKVAISPTASLSKGGVADTISIGLEPWGGGSGHAGASGGERKRADLAILASLAGLYAAPSALGVEMPMVFDDVFDTLDAAGVEEVARLLSWLAERRTVIVITQSDDLAESLRPNTAASFAI